MEHAASAVGQSDPEPDSVFALGAVPAAMVDVTSARAGSMLAANAALGRLFGVGTDALAGIDVRSAFTPTEAWSRLVRRMRRDGSAGPVRAWVALPGGELTCDLYLARLPAEGTGLLQVVATNERRHATQALRESERRLQAILDNVPALVFVKDREGRYVYMNKRCQDKFAIATGMVDSQWAPAGVAAHYVAHDREVLGLGAAREFHEVVHEDGCDRQYLSLKFPLFDDQGVPYAVAGVSTDITAIKDAEVAAGRAREAAESANRAKSEFLSRVSHELRTPLNSILGYAQVLAAAEGDDVRHVGSRVVEAGRHLLGLINELLEISRIEQGAHRMEIGAVHACVPVEEAVGLARPLAQARDVEVDVDLHAALYVFVEADARRLRQVLLNLVANGVAYGPSPGRILIDTERRGDRLAFRVTDEGAGPPPELAGRLFAPFDRLDRAGDGTDGVGLGLSLCKALVEAMDGTIGYSRGTPTGSTFWVELPTTAPPDNAHEVVFQTALPAHADTALEREARVLYVEDNDDNVEVVARALRRLGDRLLLTTARTLTEAQALVDTASFDVVLLDLHLPDGSGLTLLEGLGGRARHAPPVIVLSADATARQINRLTRAGAAHYLTKPLDLDLLVATVRTVLSA